MAYQNFIIPRTENTYANLLEAYGLANLIKAIDANIRMEIYTDNSHVKLSLKKSIDENVIDTKPYFQIVRFIQNKSTTKPPENIGENYYNYTQQRDRRKAMREEIDIAYKDKELKKDKDKLKTRLKMIDEKYNQVLGLEEEYDVYSKMISNPYSAFTKLYNNLLNNESHFPLLLKTIFDKYTNPDFIYDLKKNKSLKLTHQISQLQLFNPNKGSGLNKAKANALGSSNIPNEWISEILKISGALNSMLCQNIKVGSSYDMKVYVPEFNEIPFSFKKMILSKFKSRTKNIKGSSSAVKLDIINILLLNEIFIKNSEKYIGKPRKTVKGLHSVYQKDLGNNKAVTNISFINTPSFIEINDKTTGKNWLRIIKEQLAIIQPIEERGDAIRGLLAYRNFLSGGDIESYFKFLIWYATYFMQALSKENYYITALRLNTLDSIFDSLNNLLTNQFNIMKFQEITQNGGFQSIATAIRKSTVTLMYTPKASRNFEVKYGLARHLQNKSKTNEELITFISDFIASYNTESARKSETGKGRRTNVREDELQKFYELVDTVDNPKMLGAMLAAYGFALNAKEEKEPQSEEV